MFRRDLTECLKSPTQVFATALENMSHSMAQMGSVFAQSMGILDMTENMHRFHQSLMNMNLNLQLQQISGQPHHNNKIMPPLNEYMDIYHQTCHQIIIVKIIIFIRIFHETKADFGAIGHLKRMYIQVVEYLTCICFQKCISM